MRGGRTRKVVVFLDRRLDAAGRLAALRVLADRLPGAIDSGEVFVGVLPQEVVG